MTTITRRDRLVDLVALLLIVAGVACYAHGTWRLRQISRFSYQHPGPRGTAQLEVADNARYEANAGIALVVLGASVGIVGAMGVARRRVA